MTAVGRAVSWAVFDDSFDLGSLWRQSFKTGGGWAVFEQISLMTAACSCQLGGAVFDGALASAEFDDSPSLKRSLCRSFWEKCVGTDGDGERERPETPYVLWLALGDRVYLSTRTRVGGLVAATSVGSRQRGSVLNAAHLPEDRAPNQGPLWSLNKLGTILYTKKGWIIGSTFSEVAPICCPFSRIDTHLPMSTKMHTGCEQDGWKKHLQNITWKTYDHIPLYEGPWVNYSRAKKRNPAVELH